MSFKLAGELGNSMEAKTGRTDRSSNATGQYCGARCFSARWGQKRQLELDWLTTKAGWEKIGSSSLSRKERHTSASEATGWAGR